MSVEKNIKMGIVLGISGLTLGFASHCLADEAKARQNYMQLKLGALLSASDMDDEGFDAIRMTHGQSEADGGTIIHDIQAVTPNIDFFQKVLHHIG